MIEHPQGAPSNHLFLPRQNVSSEDRGIYLLKSCYQFSTTDQFDDQGTSYSVLFTSSLPGMRQVTVYTVRWPTIYAAVTSCTSGSTTCLKATHSMNCMKTIKSTRLWTVNLCFEWQWSLLASQSTFLLTTILRHN